MDDKVMRITAIAKTQGEMIMHELIKGEHADIEQLARMALTLHCVQGLMPEGRYRDITNNLIHLANIESCYIQLERKPDDLEAKAEFAKHRLILKEYSPRYLEGYEVDCQPYPLGSDERINWIRLTCMAHISGLGDSISVEM